MCNSRTLPPATVLDPVGVRASALLGAGEPTIVDPEEAAEAMVWTLGLTGGLASLADRNQSKRMAMTKRERTIPRTTVRETNMNRSAAKATRRGLVNESSSELIHHARGRQLERLSTEEHLRGVATTFWHGHA